MKRRDEKIRRFLTNLMTIFNECGDNLTDYDDRYNDI